MLRSPREYSRNSIVRQVERGSKSFREISCGCDAPIVQKHYPRLFPDHMLMDRNDVDSGLAQSFQNVLKLGLVHREIAINYRLVVTSGKCAPRVHAHLVPDRDIMHS